ncbi:MAG: hypothetical protein IH897_04175, partial [Planctomycetes bacterium]|nr:hypothetical protein [Planctomycetota bacterium]
NNCVDFALVDVYAYTPEFSQAFPSNRNVEPKVRQILQRLRDERFLSFSGEGRYTLNLEYEELCGEAVQLDQVGIQSPATKRVMRNVRLRSSFLGAEIKRRYGNLCQACREPVLLTHETYYAEAHHLRPLGAPHLGPDVLGNIVVLCPNHHVMFDRGVASSVPDTLALTHIVDEAFSSNARLYLEPWHVLKRRHLEYHYSQIFGQRYNTKAG